jgi:hypothetical protein
MEHETSSHDNVEPNIGLGLYMEVPNGEHNNQIDGKYVLYEHIVTRLI